MLDFQLNSVFDSMYYSLIIKNKAPIRHSIKYMALIRYSANPHPGPQLAIQISERNNLSRDVQVEWCPPPLPPMPECKYLTLSSDLLQIYGHKTAVVTQTVPPKSYYNFVFLTSQGRSFKMWYFLILCRYSLN